MANVLNFCDLVPPRNRLSVSPGCIICNGYHRCYPAAILLLFLPRSILNILMHPCCYSAAIASLMCRVASVRPCRIRITPNSWNRKWPQVKLRSELTISEQCSENISHKHALSYKKQRPALRVGIRPRRTTMVMAIDSTAIFQLVRLGRSN